MRVQREGSEVQVLGCRVQGVELDLTMPKKLPEKVMAAPPCTGALVALIEAMTGVGRNVYAFGSMPA